MECTRDNPEIPSPDELKLEEDPEKIRELLNSHAVELLRPSQQSRNIDYERYNRFCEEYDEAIYRAWYVTTKPPRNKIFGYTIEDEVADGAFGRVFRARDYQGRNVAIKVLREEVRRKPEMLQSFRRGVRSMRILAQREVQGMIPYEEASEIPAVAAMEFVEGPNLQLAVESGLCNDWFTVLEIGVQISNIIRRAHLLPERVLHRDLRPPNIMLSNYYIEIGAPKVVILDFDLSWHIGAQEASVVNRSSLSGFLAPEQVLPNTGMSTRSAAVDSFGLGMTLYYLRTGQEPHYLQHLHRTWEEDLFHSILAYPCDSWQSIPMRFARLILNSTKHKQEQRWDMGQMEGELELLRGALLNPREVRSAEFITEELAHRIAIVCGYPRYNWNPNRLAASLCLASGAEISIIADENTRSIKVKIEWSNLGDRRYKNVRKYLKPAMDESVSSLQARGWKILPATYMRSSEAGFTVTMGVEELADQMQRQADEIANMLNKFNF
jgi:serine/threonine protein kinase